MKNSVAFWVLFIGGCSLYLDLDDPPEASPSDLDMSAADMSVDLPPDTGTEEPCVGEVDRELCEGRSATCGQIQVFDRCGTSRTVECGLCRSIQTCTDNACLCVPETDAELCARLGKNCGESEGEDRCGLTRTLDCGSCGAGEECGEQSPNVCGCPCQIGGVCYPEDSPNPENPCQSCQPGLDAMNWSNRSGSCDDGDLCTLNDTCVEGTCVGETVICEEEVQCNIVSCQPDNGLCEAMPGPDGLTCDDGNLCTVRDKCVSGQCIGNAKVCPVASQCENSTCSLSTGQCVTTFKPNGTQCNDGNSCTINDSCQSGACVGKQVMACLEAKQKEGL